MTSRWRPSGLRITLTSQATSLSHWCSPFLNQILRPPIWKIRRGFSGPNRIKSFFRAWPRTWLKSIRIWARASTSKLVEPLSLPQRTSRPKRPSIHPRKTMATSWSMSMENQSRDAWGRKPPKNQTFQTCRCAVTSLTWKIQTRSTPSWTSSSPSRISLPGTLSLAATRETSTTATWEGSHRNL